MMMMARGRSSAECRLIQSPADEYGSVSLAADLVEGDLPMDGTGSIKFIDFVPKQLKEEGWVTEAGYEKFGTLLERANQWLAKHQQWRIQNCESIVVNVSWDSPGDKESSYMENGREPCVTILRMWVREHEKDELTFTQKIGCVHAIPKCLTPEEDNQLKLRFATYDDTMEELNERLSQNPLPGTIINVETCELRFHIWNSHADIYESYWKRSENESVHYLSAIKVFYELGKPALQHIGAKSITPIRTSFNRQESVTDMVRKVSSTLEGTAEILNVQTCNYRLTRAVTGSYDVLDAANVYFSEEHGQFGNFMQFLRIYYTEGGSKTAACGGAGPPEVHHKTIIPRQLSKTSMCCNVEEFENIQKSMGRVSQWVRASGANVLNVETVAVHHIDVTEVAYNTEQTYTDLCPDAWFHFYIFVYRLYIRGAYRDPLSVVRVSLEERGTGPLDRCSVS